MNLQLDPVQAYYVERNLAEHRKRLHAEKCSELNERLEKLANGVKFCAMCGGEGHEAKDCKWNKNLV